MRSSENNGSNTTQLALSGRCQEVVDIYESILGHKKVEKAFRKVLKYIVCAFFIFKLISVIQLNEQQQKIIGEKKVIKRYYKQK